MATKLNKAQKLQEKNEQIAQLKELLQPGSKIHAIVRSVSASGMSRKISFMVIHKDGYPMHINYAIHAILGYTLVGGYHDAIQVRGVGYNHISHVVGYLSRELFGDERSLTYQDL